MAVHTNDNVRAKGVTFYGTTTVGDTLKAWRAAKGVTTYVSMLTVIGKTANETVGDAWARYWAAFSG